MFSSPTSSQPPPVNTQNMKDVRDDVGDEDDDEDDVKDEDGDNFYCATFPQRSESLNQMLVEKRKQEILAIFVFSLNGL